jgi:hypothetical protein
VTSSFQNWKGSDPQKNCFKSHPERMVFVYQLHFEWYGLPGMRQLFLTGAAVESATIATP